MALEDNWWFYHPESHYIIETILIDHCFPFTELAACGESFECSYLSPREPYCELCKRYVLLKELGE